MKKFSIYLIIVITLSNCSTNEKKSETLDQKGDESLSGQSTRADIPLETIYHDLKADTLISIRGFALIVYERKTAIEPKEIIGTWQELKMDSLKGNHILYEPCDAGIQSFTFNYVDDTLHMQWFHGQSTDDLVINEISHQGLVRLNASRENILINLDYLIKPVQGASWRYDKSAVFRWTDAWGKSRTEIFVEKTGADAIEYVKQAPCDSQ